MNDKSRSHAMDGLKLLFMLVIVIHHSNYFWEYFHHGYMAVDLFFVISGFFLWQTLQGRPQLGAGGYFLRRISKLYPHYLLSFAAMFLSTSVYKVGTITSGMLVNALPEIFLVQNLGIFPGGVNYPCWYLSVLVFAGALVFLLGRKLPLGWFNTLAVLCSVVSYGYIFYYAKGSMETFAMVGVFYLPFWRGMAGLFCGALLYQLHERLQPIFRKYAAAFCVLEIVSLFGVIALMFSAGQTDAPILAGIFILLLCVGSETSLVEKLSGCTAVKAAIPYEYAVFLNHAFVIGMVKKLFRERFDFPTYVDFLVLLAALAVYSVITETFVKKAVELLNRMRKKEKTC